MLSKLFALFAAFAALTPAFAIPVLANGVVAVTDNYIFDEMIKRLEFTDRDSGCGIADIDVIVSNVLNNVTINVLKRDDDCDVAAVTAVAIDILNNLHVNVAPVSKREVTSSQLADAVEAKAQSQGITLASRSHLEYEGILEYIAARAKGIAAGIAARAKGSDYSLVQIVNAIMIAMQQSEVY